MKRTWLSLMGFVAALLLFAWFGPDLLSGYVARQVEREIRAACSSCEAQIAGVRVSLLRPGHINIFNLRITGGDKRITYIAATAVDIELHIALWPLRQRTIEILDATLTSPDVTLIDADGHSPPDRSPPSAWDLVVRQVTTHGGTFHYVRDTHGTSARLKINNIELHAAGFGTPAEFRDRDLAARARFQLEKSGAIDLRVITRPFADPLPVNVDFTAHGQNLADLTPFFRENAGVVLNGELTRGHAWVHMLGSHLEAVVRAEYKGFDVRVVKMYDRNELTAFFTNLGMNIAMERKNQNQRRQDKVRTTELERKPGDSVVSFILTGLKQAALKVTMPELTSEASE